MSPPIKPLTARDLETLRALRSASDSAIKHDCREAGSQGFVRTMDCGGTDGSHHSVTLVKLVKRGLAEVYMAREKKPWRSKLGGGKRYRITDAGRAMLPPAPKAIR